MILELIQFTRETEPVGFRSALVNGSRQPHIVATTPKDSRERFVDDAAIDAWWDKGRIIEGFFDGDTLAAMVWFSKERYIGALLVPATFAIRIYEGYVGRGLGLEVMQRAHEQYFETHDVRFVYLDVLAHNAPALKLYNKYGYMIIGECNEGDDRRYTMLYDREAHESDQKS